MPKSWQIYFRKIFQNKTKNKALISRVLFFIYFTQIFLSVLFFRKSKFYFKNSCNFCSIYSLSSGVSRKIFVARWSKNVMISSRSFIFRLLIYRHIIFNFTQKSIVLSNFSKIKPPSMGDFICI